MSGDSPSRRCAGPLHAPVARPAHSPRQGAFARHRRPAPPLPRPAVVRA